MFTKAQIRRALDLAANPKWRKLVTDANCHATGEIYLLAAEYYAQNEKFETLTEFHKQFKAGDKQAIQFVATALLVVYFLEYKDDLVEYIVRGKFALKNTLSALQATFKANGVKAKASAYAQSYTTHKFRNVRETSKIDSLHDKLVKIMTFSDRARITIQDGQTTRTIRFDF